MKRHKPNLNNLSADELAKCIYRPLTFSGKSIATILSASSKVVAQLLHHIDYCFVESLVRIVHSGPGRWGLETSELDNPDYQFWFLIYGNALNPSDQTSGAIGGKPPLYFIVNEDYLFYPIDQIGSHKSKRLGIVPEANLAGVVNFTAFSEIDRLLTKEAINAYMREHSW